MQGFTQKQIYRPTSFASFKYSEFKIGNINLHTKSSFGLWYATSIDCSIFSKKYYEAGIFPQNIKEHKRWFRLEETVN